MVDDGEEEEGNDNTKEEKENDNTKEEMMAEEEKENDNTKDEMMAKEEEKDQNDTDSVFSSSSGFTSISNISTSAQPYIWTTERDSLLLKTAKKFKNNCGYIKWDEISKKLNTNVKKCRNRAKYLNKIKNKKVK